MSSCLRQMKAGHILDAGPGVFICENGHDQHAVFESMCQQAGGAAVGDEDRAKIDPSTRFVN